MTFFSTSSSPNRFFFVAIEWIPFECFQTIERVAVCPMQSILKKRHLTESDATGGYNHIF